MRFSEIVEYFKRGSVSVCGMKGRGKDMLMSNVVVRRKKPYISNIDYGGAYIPFKYEDIAIPSSYKDIVGGNIKPYVFPHPDGTDIYLSDCGIYFPSQYCNELNKEYRELPTFMSLSRQLGDCAVHTNCQALGRVWDKIREHQDIYILARRCIYIKWLRLVIQRVTIYDKYESALERRLPLVIPLPMFANKEMRLNRTIKLNEYESSHGVIRSRWLIYRNKSKYDTRYFKTLMKGGDVSRETNQENKENN